MIKRKLDTDFLSTRSSTACHYHTKNIPVESVCFTRATINWIGVKWCWSIFSRLFCEKYDQQILCSSRKWCSSFIKVRFKQRRDDHLVLRMASILYWNQTNFVSLIDNVNMLIKDSSALASILNCIQYLWTHSHQNNPIIDYSFNWKTKA